MLYESSGFLDDDNNNSYYLCHFQEVEVAVNGKLVEGLQMWLGDSGEAYFLEQRTPAEHLQIRAQLHEKRAVDGQRIWKVSKEREKLHFN